MQNPNRSCKFIYPDTESEKALYKNLHAQRSVQQNRTHKKDGWR
jgi:hypothetical protein